MEIEPSRLPELSSAISKDICFTTKVAENRVGVPLLLVEPAKPDSTLSHSKDCLMCGTSAGLVSRSVDYPFRTARVIIQFERMNSYECTDCGNVENSPDSSEIIQEVLGKMTPKIREMARRHELMSRETLCQLVEEITS